MKKAPLTTAWQLLLILTLITHITVAFANKKPSVKAGAKQQVKEQNLVTLNGIASDGDGSITNIVWTQTKGTRVSLINANALNPTFTSPTLTKAVTLGFKLSVTDNEGLSNSASTTVVVTPINASPTASAGESKTVAVATPVTLDGSSSNDTIDGHIVSWKWKQTAGQSVKLSNVNSPTISFKSPARLKNNATFSELKFNLTVTDNEKAKASASASVWVTTQNDGKNVNPIAKAGKNRAVTINVPVNLDGSTSSDPDGKDGKPVSYLWTQISGSPVMLNNTTTAIADFTSPNVAKTTDLEFQLTVTDDKGATNSTNLVITIREPITAPTIKTSQVTSKQVILSWSPVSDADSVNICYATTAFTSKENCKTASGTGTLLANQVSPATITGLTNGTAYHFVLIAADDVMKIASAEAIITPLAPGALNDTGINTCSSEKTNGLVCPQQAYPGQDAEYGLDATAINNTDGYAGFSFVKVSSTGDVATGNDWVCVFDNVTQLVWERKTGSGLHDSSRSYTFLFTDDKNYAATTDANDVTKFISTVNANKLCGLSNWRLPTVGELQSLVHYGTGAPKPAVDPNYFSDVPSGLTGNNNYRTISPKTSTNDSHYTVDFYDGNTGVSNRTSEQAVRLVSGDTTIPFERYSVSADGTEITDLVTGLIWRRCTEGTTWKNNLCSGTATSFTFKNALARAISLKTSSKKWRLPNIKELNSLLAKNSLSELLFVDNDKFPSNQVSAYWSASTMYNDASYAWAFSFAVPNKPTQTKKSTAGAYVRLVRDTN